ncbi:MAG TPA: 5-formyltetrahydrofolate cyclo-ligase [Thermoanaerobaculia bacterium]|nr:5-formyltetrahydrofolate cyclo-ligase [Thermoanaerobaculia bacterium]
MSALSIPRLKRTLRSEMRARVGALEPERASEAGRAAAKRLLGLPEIEAASGLLVFLSFGLEIDTQPLIEEWQARGRALFVPRLVRPGTPLEVCRSPCLLETSSFGIRQPVAEVPGLGGAELEAELDAAVVPGLAFDLECHRLGYGAGTFDRFLAERRLFTAGFGYDLQVVERVPVEAHDVALSRVVTEVRVLAPRGSSTTGC